MGKVSDGRKLSDDELARVAEFIFSKHKLGSKVLKSKVMERYGLDLGAQDIFGYIIPRLITKKWVQLTTSLKHPSAEEIKKKFGLEGFDVTHTNSVDDVAFSAASTIRDLFTQKAQHKSEVKIGFSGGNTTRKVFQALVHLLSEDTYAFPKGKTIVCHALVAGFDNEAPGTDPSSFFTYLDDCPASFDRRFVLLHAPAFVPTQELPRILNYPAIKQAQLAAAGLDVIVTSAASFNDKHSQLKKYYQKNHPDIFQALLDAGFVGDMLWLLIHENDNATMDLSSYEHRPVTLLELKDLPDRIRHGTKVVLVIGPCADPLEPCSESKKKILKAILDMQLRKNDNKYITHLVTNKRTADEFLELPGNPGLAKAADLQSS